MGESMSGALPALPAQLALPTARGLQGMTASPLISGLKRDTSYGWKPVPAPVVSPRVSVCGTHLCLCPTALHLKHCIPLFADVGETVSCDLGLYPLTLSYSTSSCVMARTGDFKHEAVLLTFLPARVLSSSCRDMLIIVGNAGPRQPSPWTQARGSEPLASFLFSGVCPDFHHRPLGGSPAHT